MADTRVMAVGCIEGASRIIGKPGSQIPVREVAVNLGEKGWFRGLESAWLPSAEQVAALVAGGSIIVTIVAVNGTMSPMQVYVGEPPKQD